MNELTQKDKEYYDRTTKHLRNMLVQIRNNPFLTDEQKEIKIAEINKQYEQIKKDFVKRLSIKQKYNRTQKKKEDKKIIDEQR